MKTRPSKWLTLFSGLFLVSITVSAARAFDFATITEPGLTASVSSAGEPGALKAGTLAGTLKAVAVPLPKPPVAAAVSPVVITVTGLKFTEIGWGPLEVRTFTKLLGVLFSRGEDKRSAGMQEEVSTLETAFEEYNAQFNDLRDAAALQPAEQGDAREMLVSDDAYLTDTLAKTPALAQIKVVPFDWSRDPGDTEATVARFIPALIQVYDTYKDAGRPIYVLAHSWGGVLMHEVMHKVAKIRPDVKIDKFVTMGTPLMPGNAIVSMFQRIQIRKQDLQAVVRKPVNVRYWKNVWSSRDPFSNEIAAADENYQDDKDVDPNLESLLRGRILHGSGVRMQAKTDLITIMNIRLWHKSYYEDYKAYLMTIDTHVNVEVYAPHIVAPLTSH